MNKEYGKKLDHQIHGIQFYRQKPIGTFIIDFYAKRIRLAIEIDGGQHYTDEGRERDIERDDYLHLLGITVLRFGNHEVHRHLDDVLEKITSTVLDLKGGSIRCKGDITF